MEITVPPGEGANPHAHVDEEEQFYVIAGELTYAVGGETMPVAAGDFVHIPRGVVHSFQNGDRQAKLLATFGPGTGIEGLFLEDSILMTSTEAYGSDQVTPPSGAAPHRQALE